MRVEVDRPIGIPHPRFAAMVDRATYGLVPRTTAADGGEIATFVPGVAGPLERFERRCIAVIHRTDDCEDKLVVTPEGRDFDDAEILEAVSFQERFFTSVRLR